MEELRLDEDFLNRELNKALFREFLKRMEYPDEIFVHFLSNKFDKNKQLLSNIKDNSELISTVNRPPPNNIFCYLN